MPLPFLKFLGVFTHRIILIIVTLVFIKIVKILIIQMVLNLEIKISLATLIDC